MEEIISLVNYINKNKIKQSDIISSHQSFPDSKIYELYQKLADGDFETEEEAETYFFPDSENRKAYFTRLKRQLKERLINNYFLIDVNEANYTDTQRAYHTCVKNMAAARMMLSRLIRPPAISIAEQTLRHALSYGFSEISLPLAKMLRTHYGTIKKDRKKFERYNEIVKEQLQILNSETTAEQYYLEVSMDISRTQSYTPEMIERAQRYAEELRPHTKSLSSLRLTLYAYTVYVGQYELANDYDRVICACQEAIEFFESTKQFDLPYLKTIFLIKTILSQTQIKCFEEAEQTVKKTLSILPEGSTNWFIAMDCYLINCFHAGRYQQAYEITEQALSHHKFENLYPHVQQHWKIHQAYINYLIQIGKINPSKGSVVQHFRLSKFLNEVIEYSRDKRGSNIAILVVQFLFLLEQKEYNRIIDKMESLAVYTQRYLRQDSTYRSNCFLKMLLKVPKHDFNRAAVSRKVKQLHEKLTEVPTNVAQQGGEIEIIPYEQLWQFALQSMDD